MKKIPNQFYILVTVLCCYYWPWYLFLFDLEIDALFTVLLLQSAVIACNFLVNKGWGYAVIIVEALSMLFNVSLFLFPLFLADYHAAVMLSALIIELLIITISMKGTAVGKSVGVALWLVSDSLRCSRGGRVFVGCDSEALQ